MATQIVSHEEVWQSLDANLDRPDGGTAQAVAQDLAISVSTARRYLDEMVERGWVEVVPTTGRKKVYWRRPDVDIYTGW